MKIRISIILLILGFSAQAQDAWSRRDRQDFRTAELALLQEDLGLAYELLQPLAAKDSSYEALNLAWGRTLLDWKGDKVAALAPLKKAAEAGLVDAWFHYGRALHRNMQFDLATEWLLRYLQSDNHGVDKAMAQRHLDMVQRARKAIAEPVDVWVENLGPDVNTTAPEYVPVVSANNRELYFTSRRDDSTARLRDPNGKFYEDIYRSEKSAQGWSSATNIGQPVNSETHDATVSLSADGNTMIFYRTNRNLTGGDLYITYKKKGQWSEAEKLPEQINSNYQEACASLSPDGEVLVFSSNRPGGYGGKDLYRVRKLPNGEWSLPKNLGPVINSPYDEDAPHLDVDGQTLYFASNGHSTIGGFDNFRSRRVDRENWTSPENLGYPVNTVDDDLYLSLDAGGRVGYFSSGRPGGFGDQDLYSLDFVYRKSITLVLKSAVRSLADDPLAATITIIDENTREIQGVYRSNAQSGKFIAVLHPLTPYKVLIEREGFDSIIDELFFPFPEESNTSSEVELPPYLLMQEQ